MLEQISIRDLGIIERAELDFAPTFTVLTGETGAGKTMVLTSIGMLLGRKVASSIVREGASCCEVEGVFGAEVEHPSVRRLEQAGGASDEGEILLSRVVKGQRARGFAGGRAVPASVLAQIGEELITVHSQSEQVRLKDPAWQLELLDGFGEATHRARLRELARQVAQLNAWERELEQWKENERYRQFEINELEGALELYAQVKPRPGEYEELKAKMQRLGNVEEIREALVAALNCVDGEYSENSAVSLLGQATRQLEKSALGEDARVGEWVEALTQARLLAQETARDVASYLSALQADPQELARTHERIALFKRGAKRANCAVLEWADWAHGAQIKLDELSGPENLGDKLEASLQAGRKAALDLASEVARERERLASELRERVNEELAGLSMGANSFEIEFTPCALGAKGTQKVAFGLRSGKGTMRALGQAVSGGELSRIMLALEVVLARGLDCVRAESEEAKREERESAADAQANFRSTLIFDEIDAGIGGQTALAVGARLARLAKTHQVIVVTHLPQVAAWADKHLVVDKKDNQTTVREVSGEERVSEISRMLAGISDSQSARSHAQELLSSCRVP